jgi:HEAT repeat protein
MRRNVLVVCIALLSAASLGEAQAGKLSVADLIADLKKGDKEKFAALEQLEALGEKAAEAVPALIELLPGKNEDVRLATAMTLGKIGKPAVDPLVKATTDKDADVRFYAIWSLAFVGPQAKNAVPAVVKAMTDPAAHVRRKAAYALGRIGADPETTAPVLVAALGDADADVREAASSALPKMGKIAVPPLIKAMQSDKAILRNGAIKTLGDIGAEAEPALPGLKAFLHDPKKGAGEQAADALAGIGTPALKTLVAAAADDNDAVRPLALRALNKMGATAVPAFIDLLGSKHLDVKRHAASILGQLQVQDKSVVIALGFATKDKDFQVRANALVSLQQMGTNAKLAEPYVVTLLTDLDPQIRLQAFHVLQSIGVDPRPGLKKALSHPDVATRIATASLMTQLNLEVALAEPILLDGLKNKDEALKMQAAHALSLRGLQEDAVVPIFIAGLTNKLPSVRRQAAESIARYGAKGRKAAPALINALEDPDDAVSAQAMAALRQVGEDPKTLLPAMFKVLRRKETHLHPAAAQIVFMVGPSAPDEILARLKTEKAPGVRLACLQVLAMVGPPAKDAVGELTKALDDTAPRARMTAARALGNIGPDAKAAEKALTKATKDGDANVQQIAKAALEQIRADPDQKEFVVKGVLTAGDPFDSRRTQMFHVVHTYKMKAGQTYTIKLNSQWDNYLRLENAKGVQLAEDDDGDGFPNARIIFAAKEDGWYRIIVTSFAPQASGPYTLTVR